jgi:hypothetical protein
MLGSRKPVEAKPGRLNSDTRTAKMMIILTKRGLDPVTGRGLPISNHPSADASPAQTKPSSRIPIPLYIAFGDLVSSRAPALRQKPTAKPYEFNQ